MKTSSLRRLTLSLVVAVSLGSPAILRAQLGDNNPTGIAGEFNGNVTTGCSYDPYTGNATRSITDIVVPGAVGAYPLNFTRTINTRTSYANYAWGAPFGRPGGWRHSYQWEVKTILAHFTNCGAGGLPSEYTVTYPDGQEVTFGSDGGSTTPGIGDRFVPIDDPHATSANCYLLLSDGGRVHFYSEILRECNGGQDAEFVFACVGIIDPFGQETTISYTNGPGTFTTTVTEPAGRNLRLCWKQYAVLGGIWVIDRVEERATPTAQVSRMVGYFYEDFNNTAGLASLIRVEYFNDPRLTAHYSYQATNSAFGGPPLIRTCDDTMYGGAMSKIAYDFATGRPHGFLWRERYFDGLDAINGPAVSTLTVPADNTKRVETRGDGPSRTFTYENELGLLKSWTDFQGHLFQQDHDARGFVSYVIDPRGQGHRTDFVQNPITGKTTQITHPLTPSDLNGRAIRVIGYDSNHPYKVASVTNERQKITTYHRDSNTAEITDIAYPDFGHEGFLYNEFGQVKRHQRRNGYYEHMHYDERGLLIYRWNPRASATEPNAPTAVAPKTTFEYYPLGHPWQDLVKTVTDPRGKTTTFEYDRLETGPMYAGRGLVSRITHHDNTYITCDHDARGNKLWSENELRQRTSYTYDDYNRIIAVQTPLPEGRTAITTYTYNPNYYVNAPLQSPYLHTTGSLAKVTTPTGIVTENHYDENFRLKESKRAAGTPEAATTRYDYDPVGNLISVIDPRNYGTIMEYDQRNRRTKVTGPPIAASDNIQYVTQWLYDEASNVRRALMPDGTTVSSDYDEVNRLLTHRIASSTEQAERVTTYTYFPSGRPKTQLDPKDQLTSFEYDERDLQTKMTYPDLTVLQGWQYDENGNTKERPTIGGPKQSFTYDDRNRLKTMRWSNGIDFSDFGYDEVSRLNSAINPYSTITREYDEGGRLKFDRQILASVLNTPSMTIAPTSVVSRKVHGGAGSFGIDLPLTGTPGIECRTGPDYAVVITFATPVSVGGATVNSGIGTVSSVSASANVVTVNLFDVSNAQLITVRVFGLSDGTTTGELIIPLHTLIGDTTADGVVNSDDSETTDRHADQDTDASNFRSDVNADGIINADDVIKVTVTAGVDVPTPPAPGPQADVNYLYDDDGKRTRLSVPAYSYNYAYDGMGRLEWITRADNPNEIRYQYSYDASSNVIGRTSYTNNTALSFVRDEVSRITEETILSGTDTLSHLHYKYDAMNRLRSTFREEDGLLDSFSYNFNGELIHPQYGLQPNGQGGFENPESVGSYVYDKAGNRLSVNGVIYEPNPLNQYTQAEGAPVGNGSQHEITSYQGVNYSYLADTRLANVQSNTGGVYQLGYDALGRTVRRTSNGQTSYIIYDGARSIIEYNAAGGMVANTVYGLGTDEIIARNNNGAGQFFLQDRMDNTVAVTGWKGELLEQYRYDAFGKPKIMGPGGEPLDETKINNNLLFNGREWISRFGFYENRARAYHPGLGRFMSEDPLGFAGGDNNLFRYCGNDPLNFSDPSGGPRTTKKRDGNDDSTAETERVVVTGHAPPDNTPNDRGFIDVNGIGGLDALNQGGGRGSSRGGSARLPRLARDSSWKGRVPNAPQSTQGMWTDMSGLPTGPNVYILTDERLLQVLNWVINEVNNAEARIDLFDIRWKNWMARFDTEFYKYGDSMFSYEGMFTNLNGTWSGFQVNYIGVGAAFAGHGVSHSDMADRVGWWNYDQYKLHFVSPEVQGKMDWAELGYDYYSGRW